MEVSEFEPCRIITSRPKSDRALITRPNTEKPSRPPQKTILNSFAFQFGTQLPHSTLDTSLQIYFSSIPICEPVNGYTEFAFEHVWLVSQPITVRREVEVCFPGRIKT